MAAMINRASLILTYDGVDISADVSDCLEDFSVTQALGGKADDLQVTVENIDGLWTGAWFPSKGAELTAKIHAEFLGAKKQLDCGTFAVITSYSIHYTKLYERTAYAAVSLCRSNHHQPVGGSRR